MANTPKMLSDLAIIVVRVWSSFGLHSLVSILACAMAQHLVSAILTFAFAYELWVWNFLIFKRVQKSDVKIWIVQKWKWEIMKLKEIGWNYYSILNNISWVSTQPNSFKDKLIVNNLKWPIPWLIQAGQTGFMTFSWKPFCWQIIGWHKR